MSIDQEIARSHAEEGMRSSLEHAESDSPGWADRATAFLKAYARVNPSFAGWMVVKAAENDRTFPTPPTGKAWGSIIKAAGKAGIIERAGACRDPNRHGNMIPLWRSLVYGL